MSKPLEHFARAIAAMDRQTKIGTVVQGMETDNDYRVYREQGGRLRQESISLDPHFHKNHTENWLPNRDLEVKVNAKS